MLRSEFELHTITHDFVFQSPSTGRLVMAGLLLPTPALGARPAGAGVRALKKQWER